MSDEKASSLRLKVITPREKLVDEEVKEVSLPEREGYIGILPGHRPLFVGLGKGVLSYRIKQRSQKYTIEGGYANISPHQVLVFTESVQDETE